jgi:hypothetical protein
MRHKLTLLEAGMREQFRVQRGLAVVEIANPLESRNVVTKCAAPADGGSAGGQIF